MRTESSERAFVRKCWARVLAHPVRRSAADNIVVEVFAGAGPFPAAAEILAAGLFSANGAFRKTLPCRDLPKLGAVCRREGRIVSYALLTPLYARRIASRDDGLPGIHAAVTASRKCDRSFKRMAAREEGLLGVLGAYTAPAERGAGFARTALAAVSDHLEAALGPRLADRTCLAAETRLLPLARRAVIMPVIARWNDARTPIWPLRDEAGERRARRLSAFGSPEFFEASRAGS